MRRSSASSHDEEGRRQSRLGVLFIVLACYGGVAAGCSSPRNQSLLGDAGSGGVPVDASPDVPQTGGTAGSPVTGAGGSPAMGAAGNTGAGGTGGASQGGGGGAISSGGSAAGGSGPGSGGTAGGGRGAGGGVPTGSGGTTTGSGGAGGTIQAGSGGTTAGSGGAAGTAGSNCNGTTPGSSCGTTCKPGTISCGAGGPICNQTNAMAGTGCGGSMVCDGAGNCVAKTADGGSCQNSQQCQNANCSKDATSGASLCCPAGDATCGSCVNEQTDNANCGACGNKCGPNRSCQSGSCACTGYALSCGGCGSWSFDSGTTEGFSNATDPYFTSSVNGVQGVNTSTTTKHDGSGSLAVTIDVDFSPSNYSDVSVQLCPSGTVNLAGYTMSGWFYFNGPANLVNDYTFLAVRAWGPSAADEADLFFVKNGQGIAVGSWLHLSVQFPMSVQADHFAIFLTPGYAWNGTMYVDSLTLTGP